MKLTAKTVQAARFTGRPRKLFDGAGLYLHITKTARTWRCTYRLDGRPREYTIGPANVVTLAEARRQHQAVCLMVLKGVDPVAARRTESKERLATAEEERLRTVTAGQLIDRWYTRRSRNWAVSHSSKIKCRLDLHVPSWFRALSAVDVRAKHIVEVLEGAESCSIGLMHRIRGYLRDLFDLAIADELVHANPVRHPMVDEVVPKRPQYNAFAHIKQPQVIGEVLTKIDRHEGNPSVTAALRLLPFVFTRPGELRGMRWSEIEQDDQLWRIPAERTKARREHIVPLSTHALRILESHANHPGVNVTRSADHDYAFPGRDGTKPISNMTLSTAMRRVGIDADVLVPHGWRHTASTALNERAFDVAGKQVRFSPDAIETQLAHKRSGVRGVYNVAEYIDERRQMLQAWGNWLDQLRNGEAVTEVG